MSARHIKGDRRRWLSAIAGVLVVSAALTSCGSSHHRNSKGRSAGQPVALSTPQRVSDGSVPGAGHQIPAKAVKTEVNIVCTSVRRGAPAALAGPVTVAKLLRYASQVSAPTQRTVVSLTRLERLGDARPLAQLVSAWQQLRAIYGSARVASRQPAIAEAVGAQIVLHERTVSALARSLGFPACAAAGRAA